jgi:hypothetical protein
VAEGLRLARQLACVALLAHRVDPVVAGAGDAEGPRQHPLAHPLAHAVGLAGQQRLVEGHAAAGDRLAVGDQLVAGLDRDHVPRHDLLGQEADERTVAHDLGVGGDQHRQLVERLLRVQLLADADVGVDDRDQAEDGVGEQPQREDEDEEAADDRVEEGEDVAGDDARDRARGGVGRGAELAQALGCLGAAQPLLCAGVLGVGRGGGHQGTFNRVPAGWP